VERKRIRSFADRRQPVWLAKESPALAGWLRELMSEFAGEFD
jgi:hypothetical protein